MSDDDYTHDDETNADEPGFLKKLRADAKAGKEAQRQLEAERAAVQAEKQELAMRRAGIDPDDYVAQLIAKANPDLVDVDSWKSEMDKANANRGPQIPQAQQDAMTRISEATAGGVASGGNVPDFETELDSIPQVVDGQYNHDYVNQVLAKTAAQATREGREFAVDSKGGSRWVNTGNGSTPAITPLR